MVLDPERAETEALIVGAVRSWVDREVRPIAASSSTPTPTRKPWSSR